MKSKTDQLISAALALPSKSRAKLAEKLLASLVEPADDALLDLWGEEAEDRISAFEQGKLRAIPGEQVFRSLKSRKR